MLRADASCRGLREACALEHLPQAQHRPLLTAAPKRARQIALALRKRLRSLAAELSFGKTPEAQYFIDHKPRRNIAMIDDQDARISRHRGRAAAQELAQIDDRQEMAAHVGETLDPGFRSRHACKARRHARHFAGLLARDEI